jgi:fibronectin type 3 domain-containing protein
MKQLLTVRSLFGKRRPLRRKRNSRLNTPASVESLESRLLLSAVTASAADLKFDFGTVNSPVDAGYTQVAHNTNYTADLGYGWSSGQVGSRDRGVGDQVTRDLNFTADGTFNADVADGTYDVTVILGDASFSRDQVDVYLEGQRVDTVHTDAGEFHTATYRVEVTDGQLNLRLANRGGSDPYAVINALEIARVETAPTELMFDFGTTNSPLGDGFTQVAHSTTFNNDLGYGWSAGQVGSRDRGVGSQTTRDLNFTPDGTFSTNVASGTYDVTVTLGDASFSRDQVDVYLEGQRVDTVNTAAGEFHVATYRVSVTDGKLDLRLHNRGGSDPYAVINALEVRSVSTGSPADPSDPSDPSDPTDPSDPSDPTVAVLGHFDFGTANSPLADGHTRVDHRTGYSDERGFGWAGGSIGSRDRGTSDDVNRDLNFTGDGTFVADVPNGTYYVTVTLGDASFSRDHTAVYLEGVKVDTVSTAAGEFYTQTYQVDVTDGQLTLRLVDENGSRTASITSLTIAGGSGSLPDLGPTPPPPSDTTGPRVVNATPTGTVDGPVDRILLTFSEDIQPSSFTVADVVSLTGPSGAITPSTINAVSSTQFEVVFPSQSLAGTYSLTVGPDILDLAGNAMDQNGNGVNGEVPQDQYTTTFTISTPAPSNAIYVATTGNDSNSGTSSQPLRSIGRALALVSPGQTIIVADGTYNETLTTRTNGSSSQRITLQAANPGKVLVTNNGRVLNVANSYYTIEGIIFDGQYGNDDLVRVTNGGSHLIFRNNTVRFGRKDGIDMAGPTNVLIENSKIHNFLSWINGQREDAHGIVTGGVKNLTVRGTEIYYVSGDALQLQYNSWDNVLVDSCHFWNGPLPQAAVGFPRGANPGEDGIDTKQRDDVPAGRLTVRNTTFNGWRGDYVANGAGVNLKHNVNVILDGNTFYDNEIAMRLRGPSSNGAAVVTAMNNVLYNNNRAIRYENNIYDLKIFNNTFGRGNSRLFQAAGGGAGSGFEVRNNLFFGSSKPSEASHSSNLTASSSDFVNSGSHNYRLAASSNAIDKGVRISTVTHDRDGVSRPQGGAYDVGAYERIADELFANSADLL